MDRIAQTPSAEGDETIVDAGDKADQPATYDREWSNHHPINLRATLPLPFGRWYVTLVAGPERRSKTRLVQEREKHPLETIPNLMFLLSVGIVSTAVLFAIATIVLIHGFGWSLEITIPN